MVVEASGGLIEDEHRMGVTQSGSKQKIHFLESHQQKDALLLSAAGTVRLRVYFKQFPDSICICSFPKALK